MFASPSFGNAAIRALALCALPGLLSAQAPAASRSRLAGGPDSSQVVRLPEVVIQRDRQRESQGTQPLAILSKSEIEASSAATLADAISFAPGVFIKRYGGLGGLQTVSLR